MMSLSKVFLPFKVTTCNVKAENTQSIFAAKIIIFLAHYICAAFALLLQIKKLLL